MLGPFRTGDVVAEYFGAVPIGGFLLGKGGVFLGAHWKTDMGPSVKDALIQFNSQGAPKVVPLWDHNDRCLKVVGGRLEVSLAGIGCQAAKGRIGVNTAGAVALTIERGDDGAFLEVNQGLVTNHEPPGYIWCSSWGLELVLGDGYARIVLGEEP